MVDQLKKSMYFRKKSLEPLILFVDKRHLKIFWLVKFRNRYPLNSGLSVVVIGFTFLVNVFIL